METSFLPLLFGTFEEFQSPNGNAPVLNKGITLYTINGYVHGHLPTTDLCVGNDVLVLVAVVSEDNNDVISVRVSGHTVIHKNQRLYLTLSYKDRANYNKILLE